APLPAAAAALDAVLAAAVLAAAVLAAAAPLTGASPSGKSTALPVRKWAWVMGSTVALLLTPSTAKSCSCLAASLRHVRYSAPSADVGGGRTANSWSKKNSSTRRSWRSRSPSRSAAGRSSVRSEERRVGKECRRGGAAARQQGY